MKKNIILILLFFSAAQAADVKWTAKTELTAIADTDILLVVDNPGGTPISKKITVLNFFDTIDTSAKLRTILGDETGTGVSVFGTAPTFTTSILLTGADANPSSAGMIVYDNTITGIMSGGGLRWFDDDSIRLLVDLETDPSNDDYVVAYDSTADGFYMKADADSGGSTVWSAIADPTNSGLQTITFDNAELSLLTGDNDAAASFFILQNTDADHTGGNFYILDLDYSADDGDVDADYLKCQDSGGVVLTIQEDGNIATNGFLATGADPADQGAIRLSNATIIAWEDATETTLTHVDNVGLLLNLELEIDGTLDADGIVILGDGGDNFSVASDGIDIDTSGNITNAGTIASGVVTVTGVINTSVGLDGVGAVDMDYGSADITDHTFTTDSTGDAEFVVPDNSIGATEIVDKTIRLPIIGFATVPDATGECFLSIVSTEMALATGLMKNLVFVLKDPSADTGFYGTFHVPQDYVDTANIVVIGILDGTVGTTSVDFEMSYLARADNETIEAAWAESVAFNTGNTNGWTDEDLLEDSAALTDGNFAAGDEVFYYFKRDQGTDDFAGDFHVTGLYFEYSD